MLLTLKKLLSSIVDYAGLFPPAQLSLPEAMVMYDRAQSSSHHWLMGRFVLPAFHLPEVVTRFSAVLEPIPSGKWSLSVILSQNWAAELEQIQQLQTANKQLLISALEIAPLSPSDMQQACRYLPGGITAFFEIPLHSDLAPYITILQQAGVAAKLRTGGITPDAVPDSIQLGQRILSLVKAQIPFKATAGLHHPLRSKHPLTYETDSASTMMHGFLNVAILAAIAYQQTVSLEEAVSILEEQAIEQFEFTETALRWREYVLSLSALERSRQQCFHSFGSCSFQEPIADLHTLRLL